MGEIRKVASVTLCPNINGDLRWIHRSIDLRLTFLLDHWVSICNKEPGSKLGADKHNALNMSLSLHNYPCLMVGRDRIRSLTSDEDVVVP